MSRALRDRIPRPHRSALAFIALLRRALPAGHGESEKPPVEEVEECAADLALSPGARGTEEAQEVYTQLLCECCARTTL